MATIQLAHGYSKYQAFCAEAGYKEDSEPIVAELAMLINDKEDEPHHAQIPGDGDLYCQPVSVQNKEAPKATSFNLNGTLEQQEQAPTIIEEEENKQSETEVAEFLKLHQQFGHCSFKKL